MPDSEFSESLSTSLETQENTVSELTEKQESVAEPEERITVKGGKKQRWTGIFALILVVLTGGFAWRWWQTSQADSQATGATAAPAAIPVKLATVEQATVEESSEFIGNLEAPRSVILKPEIEGRVSQILVKEGDRVTPGQVVIRLQSDDAQAQLLQAKAGLEQARARLAELNAGTRKEEIAQARASLAQAQARLTDAQAGARPEEIAQAQAQIEAAKSDVDLARSRAQRYQNLNQEGAISQDQLEGYLREQRSAEATLTAAQRRLDQ